MSPTSIKARQGYLDIVSRRLQTVAPLSTAARDALRGADMSIARIGKGETLFSGEGHNLHVILDGWACQVRAVAQTRRQIFAFLLPGDIIERPPEAVKSKSYECEALTPLVVADASGWLTHPGLDKAVAGLKLQMQLRLFDQVVRLGAPRAYEALAHLLLELFARQVEVGMNQGLRFQLPINHEQLGDTIGLTEVHISRTLGRLRKEGHLLTGAGWGALPRFGDLAAQVNYPFSASVTEAFAEGRSRP